MLFSDRGVLQGLLTKEDVWYVLNGAEETRRTNANDGTELPSGLTREGADGEERGLLNGNEGEDLTPIQGDSDIPIL